MTLIIVLMLLLGYVLIATGHLTGVNKAAIAMFLGTIGWVVYICWGTDFVMAQHPHEYAEYLAGEEPSSDAVKYYIYNGIFLNYVGRAASIVMFLLATMSIIEILNNNGCFDFIQSWIKTRNPKRLLWTITFATFVISANLDNLTTATMMLVIMRGIVQNRRQRMLIGSAIVIAANCGGCFTVIGDPAGLLLWGNGAVTATSFSKTLALPAILAWVIPTILINRQLPERLDTQWSPMPYRGDDTNLNQWQRIVMLFVMGIMLGMGVVTETGVFGDVAAWIDDNIHNIWIVAIFSGLLSSIVDTFTIAISNISLYPIMESQQLGIWYDADYMANFIENGAYWKVVAFATAAGVCLLSVGSVSGIALMKMEHVHLGWYLKNVSPKMLVGWLVGMAVLWAEIYYIL